MVILTEQQIEFFRSYGYLIVSEFIGPQELEAYKEEAQILVNHCYESGNLIENWGCVVEPFGCGYLDKSEVTHETMCSRNSYLSTRSILSKSTGKITLDLFGSCANQLLSNSKNKNDTTGSFLLNDQYIVKPPHSSASFAWHQDILYLSQAEKAHSIVSIWTPLDDVCEQNGTVFISPFAGPDDPGDRPEQLPDTVYSPNTMKKSDSSRGFPVPGNREPFWISVKAGTALFTDGRLWHCSTGNKASSFRTVYMPQFSHGIVSKEGLGLPLAFAIPVSSANAYEVAP